MSTAARWLEGARIALPQLALLGLHNCKVAVYRWSDGTSDRERLVGRQVELRPVSRGDVRVWLRRDRSRDMDAPCMIRPGHEPRTRMQWSARNRRLRTQARAGQLHAFTVVHAGRPVGELVARYDAGTATADLWLWRAGGASGTEVVGDVVSVVAGFLPTAHPDIRRIAVAVLPGDDELTAALSARGFEREGQAPRRVVDEQTDGHREQWALVV